MRAFSLSFVSLACCVGIITASELRGSGSVSGSVSGNQKDELEQLQLQQPQPANSRHLFSPTSTPPSNLITYFQLINADTDLPIAPYFRLGMGSDNGNRFPEYIDWNRIGDRETRLTVEARTEPNFIFPGSVQWMINRQSDSLRIDNAPPARWSLCGGTTTMNGSNVGYDFMPCNVLRPNTNVTIQATAFLGPNATGKAYPTKTFTLVIVDPGPNPPVLTLINAATNQDVRTLSYLFENTIDLTTTPTINIRADPDPKATNGTVSSVQFKLDNVLVRTENVAPYAIGGNRGRDYFEWKPPQPTGSLGTSHTITATTYQQKNGRRTQVSSVTIKIKVIKSVPTPAPIRPPLPPPVFVPMFQPPPALVPVRPPGVVPPISVPMAPPITVPVPPPRSLPVAPFAPKTPAPAPKPAAPVIPPANPPGTDVTPPRLLNFTMKTPSLINVTSGPRTVHIDLFAQDDGVGFYNYSVRAVHYALGEGLTTIYNWPNWPNNPFLNETLPAPVAGQPVYRNVTLMIGQAISQGEYGLQLFLYDANGNTAQFRRQGLGGDETSSNFTVVRTHLVPAPVLVPIPRETVPLLRGFATNVTSPIVIAPTSTANMTVQCVIHLAAGSKNEFFVAKHERVNVPSLLGVLRERVFPVFPHETWTSLIYTLDIPANTPAGTYYFQFGVELYGRTFVEYSAGDLIARNLTSSLTIVRG